MMLNKSTSTLKMLNAYQRSSLLSQNSHAQRPASKAGHEQEFRMLAVNTGSRVSTEEEYSIQARWRIGLKGSPRNWKAEELISKLIRQEGKEGIQTEGQGWPSSRRKEGAGSFHGAASHSIFSKGDGDKWSSDDGAGDVGRG